ncbi:MAG: PaaI family thioesterase [Desulfovibrio sp.]|uniref:PaaI family thioesterase n=1 Tax=Desulfovibrio sp. 7SRBS1 TaxID=3378064 RepID=UPI003B427077
MDIQTHTAIDRTLCGTPLEVGDGKSTVKMTTLDSMTADESGLVHGGFVFGLADYAAMLAVNHPNVVLGAASTKFLAPVKAGEELLAKATVRSGQEGRKQIVDVDVLRDEMHVFSGEFTCFVLDKHVLAKG